MLVLSRIIPKIIAIEACDNHSFAITISCLAAKIIKVFKELGFINTDHIKLPMLEQLNDKGMFMNPLKFNYKLHCRP